MAFELDDCRASTTIPSPLITIFRSQRVLLLSFATQCWVNTSQWNVRQEFNEDHMHASHYTNWRPNKCYYALEKLIKSKTLRRNRTLKIYRTLIRLVVRYGCESWMLTMVGVKQLRIYERILHRIFEAVQDGNSTGELQRTMILMVLSGKLM